MTDAPARRNRLVDELVERRAVTTLAVEEALRSVPRHLFVPGVALEAAYADQAIPTKVEDGTPISSASQPAIVATMLDQLDVQPGNRVLEVGAGTGYNAALLAGLAGREGRVVAVDIDEDIVEGARAHLRAAEVDGVEVVCGDGALGHGDGAPYDRIIATVGVWDVPPAWWDQLAPGGRIVAPISLGAVQRSVALEERDGRLESVSVRDCGFMRLRGPFAGPEAVVAAGPMRLTFGSEVDSEAVRTALDRPSEERVLDVEASRSEVFGGLALSLALHDPAAGTVQAMWPADGQPPIAMAATFEAGERVAGWSICTLDAAGVAALGQDGDRLTVYGYGDAGAAVDRMAAGVLTWDAAARPGSESLVIRAHRAGTAPAHAGPATIRIEKRWSTFLVDWPGG